MSMEAITKVFKNSKTEGNALLILLSLADWCDQDFSCFPSIKRIAEKARVSEPTAKRYMRAFMKMGLITKEAREDNSGRQTSNRYYLNVEMIGSDEVTKDILDSVTYDSQRQEWEGVTRVSGGEGVSGLTGGGGKSIYRGEGVSGLTGAIMNHQKEPKKEPSCGFVADAPKTTFNELFPTEQLSTDSPRIANRSAMASRSNAIPGKTAEFQARANRLMNRRNSTPWSKKELISARPHLDTCEEDWQVLEKYYACRGQDGYFHRTSMQTLLNNFASEIDKARSKQAASEQEEWKPRVI